MKGRRVERGLLVLKTALLGALSRKLVQVFGNMGCKVCFTGWAVYVAFVRIWASKATVWKGELHSEFQARLGYNLRLYVKFPSPFLLPPQRVPIERLRQEDIKSEAHLGYILIPCVCGSGGGALSLSRSPAYQPLLYEHTSIMTGQPCHTQKCFTALTNPPSLRCCSLSSGGGDRYRHLVKD